MSEKGDIAGSSASTRKKGIFGPITTIGVLVLAEIAFRALGIFTPDAPFTRFVDERGEEMVRYTWNSPPPRFSPQKPKGSFRIMVAGGSTALGFPYHPRSSFGIRLKVLLERSFPGLEVELVNLGSKGMNSREVAEVAAGAVEYSPDLIIVYTGHNEFIVLQDTPGVLRVR